VVKGVGLPYHHKPFWMLIGQWPEEHSFDDAEDGRVRADAKPEGKRNHYRKTRRPLQLAQTKTQIATYVPE
jgi:hypothetical protein